MQLREQYRKFFSRDPFPLLSLGVFAVMFTLDIEQVTNVITYLNLVYNRLRSLNESLQLRAEYRYHTYDGFRQPKCIFTGRKPRMVCLACKLRSKHLAIPTFGFGDSELA